MNFLNAAEVNEICVEIHKQNKERGWWDEPNRNLFVALQLCVTEVAEATEGDRRSKMDEHLPERKMAEVELADTFIRLADIAGYLDVRLNYFRESGLTLGGKGTPLAEQHLKLVCLIGDIAMNIGYENGAIHTEKTLRRMRDNSSKIFEEVFGCIKDIAEDMQYDLVGAIEEKLEYNKKRKDHDRSARQATGGKKY